MIERLMFEDKKALIKRVLSKALETEYYSTIMGDIDIEQLTYDEFRKIPVLDKITLNRNMLEMLTSKYEKFDKKYYINLPYSKKREYLNEHGLELRVTSGSTSNPIEVIKSKEDINRDYITLNWYRHKLTSYKFMGKFVWVWPVNPLIRSYFYPEAKQHAFWEVNKYGTQYMLYSYSEENFKLLYEFIVDNQIEWITASPNSLVNFIDYMDNKGISINTIKYIECHSEYLYSWQKEKILKAFKCEVVSIYSSNEVQFIGGTCKEGHMHLFDSSCFMELLNNEYGGKDVYITALNYLDVPIIRYKLGDCGEWGDNQYCEYLREKAIFYLKKYRENDYIVGEQGNKYEPFIITDSIVLLKNTFDLPIKLYRVKQINVNKFEYYFDECVNISNEYDCQILLENYLSKILKYKVFVNIYIKDIKKFTFYGSKFKYFEVDKKLLNTNGKINQ